MAGPRYHKDRVGTGSGRCLELFLLHVQTGFPQPAHNFHKHKTSISTVLIAGTALTHRWDNVIDECH